jgi:hypothetical protein
MARNILQLMDRNIPLAVRRLLDVRGLSHAQVAVLIGLAVFLATALLATGGIAVAHTVAR